MRVGPDRLLDRLAGLGPCLEVPVEEILALEDAVEPLRLAVLVAVQLLGHARPPSEVVQQRTVCA